MTVAKTLSHAPYTFLEMDIRHCWFNQFGISSALRASQRLKDVCSRTIHFAGETQYAFQKELF